MTSFYKCLQNDDDKTRLRGRGRIVWVVPALAFTTSIILRIPGAVMKARCMPAPPPVFKVDHPFFFGIFDDTNQVFLFWGRIAHPTEMTKSPGTQTSKESFLQQLLASLASYMDGDRFVISR